MRSPTARTLARLRELGYRADVVERRLPGCLVTRDLFGIADAIAVHPGARAVLLVQATTAGHVVDRLRRVRGQPDLPALLAALGCEIEVRGPTAGASPIPAKSKGRRGSKGKPTDRPAKG